MTTTILIILLSVWIGGFLGYILRNKSLSMAKYGLVFSGGFLLSITLLEIFPYLFKENTNDISYWILGGVIIQIFLESLTKGIEHGHIHKNTNSASFPFSLLIGLFLHSLLEGIPLSDTANSHLHEKFTWGIFIHNIPVSFLLSFYLFNSKLNYKYSVLIILLFSLATPFGILGLGSFMQEYESKSLAIVGGIFLHISSLILFESNKNHTINFIKLISVLLGVFAAIIVT